MFTPQADGGHALYTQELLSAMSSHPRGAGFRFELVTSQNLQARFRTGAYPVHTILPPLADRSTFKTTAGWVSGRVAHYVRRERLFLRWLAARPDLDAVHFQEWVPWLAARLSHRIRAMGKRVYYTMHNIAPHKYPRLIPRAVWHGCLRRACRQCDGLFVHTDQLAGQLSRFLGQPHPRIVVVPHGVWTVPGVERRPPMHERLAWKRLLFFGSIRRNKGLDLLLRAAPHLTDYSVTIAGEPWEPDYFRDVVLPLVAKARQLGMQVDLQARFIAEDEIEPLFARHSAVVLPYTSEFVAQSGVVFMALAHEVPVVASEAGGLRDLLGEHAIGVTFQNAAPTAIAAAVRELCERHAAPVAAHSLLSEVRAAKHRYSWKTSAGATLEGYSARPANVEVENDCLVETTSAV
jgi:glycosyltransferase involved in cell wall biosynthesis